MSAKIFFSAERPPETSALVARRPVAAKTIMPTPRARHQHQSPSQYYGQHRKAQPDELKKGQRPARQGAQRRCQP